MKLVARELDALGSVVLESVAQWAAALEPVAREVVAQRVVVQELVVQKVAVLGVAPRAWALALVLVSRIVLSPTSNFPANMR
ncbi:MAG: hypothetical protein U9M97_01655 [Candidatus Hadarchaeota archaeon]|nr:hypothetical protein [Candidatus Hadarchaeota archaeon]